MKTVSLWILSLLCVFLSSTASADFWIQGIVTEIQIIAAGNANDRINVIGNFNPTTGCAINGFELGSGDSFFKQSFAAILTAKATGTPLKVLVSYCDTTTGFARANGYSVISN